MHSLAATVLCYPITMHCWKAILKSQETVSLVEDFESRAHLLTSFLINF